MLTIYGSGQRYCDGISRRSFLKIGSLALWGGMGLSLTDIMRAEAATGKRQPHKAVIHVYLGGGPPHQDTFDLKPDAPADIRGEFKPIKTKVPGIEICEVFPKLAQVMDKMTIIRTVVGCAPDHDAYQCMTGWPRRALAQQGGYPAVGSVLAKLQGPIDRAVPPAVGLAAPTQERRWSDSGSPGFLGPAYAPFKPFGVAATKSDNGTEEIVGRYEGGDGIASLK